MEGFSCTISISSEKKLSYLHVDERKFEFFVVDETQLLAGVGVPVERARM